MEVIVKPRQTLQDIAIQVYGDIRAVADIAKANDIAITDDIMPGTILMCPEVVYDRYLQDYVSMNAVSTATALDGNVPLKGVFSEEFTKEYM